MTGPACGNNPNYRMSDGDRQAVDSFRAYLTARGALRDRIAAAMARADGWAAAAETLHTMDTPAADRYRRCADAVLADLPRRTADDVAAVIGPTMLLGLQDAELDGEGGMQRIHDWIKRISEAVIALPAVLPATTDQTAELTTEEARSLADDLGLQLYRAQDALAFVGECCTIAEREQRAITTTDVREWLKGAQCGRQLAAEAAELRRMADETQPAETEAAELLALATVLEIPRPGNALPLQLRRSYGHANRWAICDREGRRWDRELSCWVYEAEGIRDEALRDATRFTLAEAVPLARKLAAGARQDGAQPS
ncbi:hypothetical protein ACFW6Q_15075 [Streptomyces sp. NPDC058737]|uniref:hypothetical protein n=1 Tax=Streptomyces sp. NPDC058737 TaxID=3346617 RepID=UPI0036B769CD